MEQISLPKVSNEYVAPKKGSQRYRIVRQLAPNPEAVIFYPEIPRIGSRIWALWRNGMHGYAEYVGAWTYKADEGQYINEMPVAWFAAPRIS